MAAILLVILQPINLSAVGAYSHARTLANTEVTTVVSFLPCSDHAISLVCNDLITGRMLVTIVSAASANSVVFMGFSILHTICGF